MPKESAEALKMLKTALEMEEKGKRFYEKAVEECPNEVGREIFGLLKNEELKHIERIKEIYAGLQAGREWAATWSEFPEESRGTGAIFRELARKHGLRIKAGASDLEALDIGLEFEAASVKFYESHLSSGADPVERKFVSRMVEEERKHYELLKDLKFYYTDPEGWMMEKGRTGLDGA